MRTHRGVVIGVGLAFAIGAAACGKGDKKDEKKMAKLCVEAERILGELANQPDSDPDLFMKTMANAIEACEAGCSTEKDDASCKNLEGIIDTICNVSEGICKNLCEVEGDKKYKELACARAKT